MNPIPPDNTPEDIARLEALAQTLHGFDPGIDAEWIDGYLTALAATGRPMLAAEWLPQMFEDSFERAFGDPTSHAEAVTVLETRLAMLRRQLDAECLLEWPERLRLNPWMAEVDDEWRERVRAEATDDAPMHLLETGAGWFAGFADCVDRHHAWWPEPEEGDEDAPVIEDCWQSIELLFLPVDDPERVATLQRLYPEGAPDREQLVTDALYAVQDLRVWQVDHAPRPETVHAPVLPGRNEPCWCGSGRKFKKCHGA